MRKIGIVWGIYACFVLSALYINWHDDLLSFDGSLAPIKLFVWACYLTFLGFSIYCSVNESLFLSISKVGKLYWGRQIAVDLYIGLMLFLFIVYLHQGAISCAFWLLPALAFGNLAVLLYFAIYFESLIATFIA